MDIYKLTDFRQGTKGAKNPAQEHQGIPRLKITDLKQGLKNPDRVNVFIDGEYSFSLDISQVIDFKVKVGKVLKEEELSTLKKASEFGKLYQRTLEWALTRPRSEREVSDYLNKKIRERSLDDPSLKSLIITRLKQNVYLDDSAFAKFYVENRFVKKGISKKRLMLELSKKGIKRDLAEEVLASSERDDASELKKIIQKKRAKYPDDQKLIQYLCRQGFSYDLVRELVSAPETD